MFHAGIDPGYNGGIGLISGDAKVVQVWDMPITGTGRDRQIDMPELESVFKRLARYPALRLLMEYPTTRPGEGAERSKRFGEQLGILRMGMHCLGLPGELIAPNLWKARLGLPGKQEADALKRCVAYWDRQYPSCPGLVRGPRGGIKDGRLDALLIAHFSRQGTLTGLRGLVQQHGQGSPEVMAKVIGGGRRKGKKRVDTDGIVW